MSVLELRVLGPFTVVRAGRPLPLGRTKSRDLLALLAAAAPRPVAPDSIADELWHGAPPPSACKVVQKHVSELRHVLGRAHVVSLPSGYQLASATIDAALFERALAAARHDGPAEARRRLTDALAMWRGEPFEDIELDSLVPVRAQLTELRLAAIEHCNEARLLLGGDPDLVADLERLVVEHPLRESFWSELMRALDATGRPADALRAFQRLRTTLATELGIEPSGELRQLERQLLCEPSESPSERTRWLGRTPDVSVDELPGEEPQRRVMTVVAVDLAAPFDDDPEHRARAIGATAERIGRRCAAVESSIESVLGTRLMIVFGVPAHEDDADRAVHLARQIVAEHPTAKAAVATGWALRQPAPTSGPRIVGSVVEVACSALATTAAGTVHIDVSTAEARAQPISDPPFMGRRHEIAVLSELIARAATGHGPHVISVRGEPGVGKTRLVHELRRGSPIDVAWRQVRCPEGAGPAAALEAVLDDHLGDVATTGLPGTDPFDELVHMLGIETAEGEWLRRRIGPGPPNGEAPIVERSELVAAWVTYLAGVARLGPTVVAIDDVHRADPAFPELLTDCLAQLRSVPLIVILTARPDRSERRFGSAHIDQLALTLRGLEPQEMDALLGHLLDDDSVTEDQAALVHRRSSGNPLYAIHFARMLRQQGWTGSIPYSTYALIAARLDLLAPLERAVLSVCAVIGQPFGAAQVAALQGIDTERAGGALGQLVDRALLVWQSRDELMFSHDLVRDVAYEGLVRSRRRAIHTAAAEWIERRSAPQRLAENAMRIANHLAAAAHAEEEDGGDSSELRHHAFGLMILAGDTLRGRGAEDIVAWLDEAAQDEHPAPELAHLHLQRAAVLARLGRLRDATEASNLGLAAAQRAGDRSLEARLGAMVGEVHWLRGDTSASLDALQHAMALVEDMPTDRAAAEAIATIAFVTALLGRPAEAVVLAERGLVLAQAHGLADKEVRCLNARGAALLLQGDLAGYSDFMRALARALEAGLGHESAMAYHNLAELQMQGAGTASSAEMNERGLELAERRGLSLAGDWLRANRVQLFVDAGRWDEALDIAAHVVGAEAAAGSGQAGTACAVWSARIHVWRGQLDEATTLMDVHLPRARQHAVIQQLGPALVVVGLLATASGDPDAGAAYAAEFCRLTDHARAYRHMELADVVRLLVAGGRLTAAREACDDDVIATIRNQCQTATARATIARAEGDPGAGAMFHEAAALWQRYGDPLEEHLALAAAAADGSDPAGASHAARLAADLGLSAASVAALSDTGSRPDRNR